MTREEAIKCLVQEVGIRAECYRSYLAHYGKQDEAEEDFLDALYSAIDALREQPQWIRVEDEKPPRRGHYFIAYKFAGSDMRFYGKAVWHDDIPDNGYVKGDHFSNEGLDGMYVTHWMHIPKLPEPPKEEV